MDLRQYQKDCLEILLKNEDNPLLAVLHCGAGKTEIFIELLRQTPEKKSLVILNRIELLDQTIRRINQDVNIFCGSRKMDVYQKHPITIGSIQSLKKAIHYKFDQIIVDECHFIDFDKKNSAYLNLFERHPTAKIFGFTATPYRQSGHIYGPDKLFKKIHYERPIRDGVKEGFIVDAKLKGSSNEASFDTSKLKIKMGDYDQKQLAELGANEAIAIKQVKDAWLRSLDRKKIVWFCIDINHAEMIRRLIPEESAIIHSKMSESDRWFNKQKFEETECRHLVFVNVLAVGWDYPPADTLVILRPTRSPTLYVQVVGRILRTYPGKQYALVLDYGRVVERLGPIDNPKISKPSKGGWLKDLGEQLKMCPQCFEFINWREKLCPECGYSFESKKDVTKKPEEELSVISKPDGESVFVIRVDVVPHTSMNGNACTKFTYYTGRGRRLKETFVNKMYANTIIKKMRAAGFRDSAFLFQDMISTNIGRTRKLPHGTMLVYKKTNYGIEALDIIMPKG